jgi:diguanylate cyclase (GGDEF)-like protein/PAS domain S-box-containing protein
MEATLNAIEDYPSEKISEDEKSALHAIRNIVMSYANNINLIEKMIDEGKTSNEIDFKVRVNDLPATDAFRFIEHNLINNSRKQVLENTKALEQTLDFLKIGISLISSVMLIMGIVLILFLRKTVLASHKLQSTSKYLNDILNAAPDAMLIIDEKGIIADANSQAVSLFGYTYNNLMSMNINSLMPERYREPHINHISSSFKNTQKPLLHSGGGFRALTKDDKEIPVEISINYTFHNKEKYAITTLRDVTNRETTERALRDKEDMLSKAQNIARIGSWDWNLKKDSFIWSEEMYHIFNIAPGEFAANYDAFVEHIHPEDRDKVVNALNAAIITNQTLDLEHRILHSDGNERIAHLLGEVYRDADGNAEHLVGTMHDISKLKRTENELRLADNVFKHTVEGIMITNANKEILRVNSAFTTITGYSAKEAMGHNPRALLKSGKHNDEFYNDFWAQINGKGSWEGEIWDRRKDGKIFPSWHNICAVTDENKNVIQYISIFNDITDKKIAEDHIEHLAQYDQLTKLPNRVLFNDRLELSFLRATRSNEKVALMFIDLDRFKNVNDTLGHQAGDQLLQEISQRLSNCIRQQDTVARLGGDEFTIILENLKHAESSAIVANKILEALSHNVQLGEHEVTIGGSIGISVYPDDGTDTKDIIKNADMAMYQAKNLGKNQYQFYTKELTSLADRRFHTENRLRKALNNNELELYYQPQINTQDGKLIGAEALIRWNDPDKGLIPPDEFIPLAEEVGMIEEIGKWVIDTACTQGKQWQDQGYPPIRISVNLSGYQITHGEIVETVARILKKTNFLPEHLELEILENFVMDDPERGVLTIKALRYLGVSLAIDDFGTGYSSLSYLKQLSIDRLKIDRSFVIDTPHNKDDSAIVSTIIAMARNLGLSVIAEGVENKEHIKFLRENNCIEMQGFYFSKPVPVEEFAYLFKKSYPELKSL